MRGNTEKIQNKLEGTQSITEFLNENKEQFDLLPIGEYIEMELAKRKIKKQKVINESGISKRYFNQILSGEKTPARRYIIRIFLSLGLDLPDVQWYLKACDYSQLFVKNKRDAIIIYSINNKLPVGECNKMLNKAGLENLGFENLY